VLAIKLDVRSGGIVLCESKRGTENLAENNRVCRAPREAEPPLVVWSQVNIHDPAVFDDKLLLNDYPLIPKCCQEAGFQKILSIPITGSPVTLALS
jgi:hypothetical protein